jgi:RimJ/RimL family protein N-acetyltransferase
MRIDSFDPATDLDQARTYYRLYADCHLADTPDEPMTSERVYLRQLTTGWRSERQLKFLASDTEGICGGYALGLPQRENLHLGELILRVTPGRRRRGYGTELLRHAANLARADGRTLLSFATRSGTSAEAFASAVGARVGLVEVRRMLELDSVPGGRLASLRRRAETASAGYSLLSWTGAAPEEHVEQLALVASAMADAPRSPAEQAAHLDAQRVREDERRLTALGGRRYTLVARCDATGELAGLTRITVDEDEPARGLQHHTVVTRPHRGHRLGLLLKVAMLEWLAGAEPGLRHIVTDNASTNEHMNAINDELGFRAVGGWKFWELDSAAIPA